MARTPKVVEDRREQIMDAALRVFAEKGFARATNKDIAREAGITPGLIYHYFKSKEALFQAIVERQSPLQFIRSFPAEMLTRPPEIVLRFLAERMLVFTDDERFMRLVRVFLSESMQHPELSPLVGAPVQEATGFLARFIQSKMASGELRRGDAALVAQLFMGSIMDLVMRRHVLHDPTIMQFTHEQIAEQLVTMALQGLSVR